MVKNVGENSDFVEIDIVARGSFHRILWCAKKLHYRKIKEREQLESRQRENYKKNRKSSKSDDEVDDKDNIIDENRTKSDSRDKESSKRRRKRANNGDTIDEEIEKSKEGKKKEESLVVGWLLSLSSQIIAFLTSFQLLPFTFSSLLSCWTAWLVKYVRASLVLRSVC